jgi:hypothetical protein
VKRLWIGGGIEAFFIKDPHYDFQQPVKIHDPIAVVDTQYPILF